MNVKLKPQLKVESLESRDTPSASLTFSGGTLTIRGDNTANNLLITETAGNLAVSNNAANMGTYHATNLSITMGNSNDTVTLNLTDTTGIAGTLSVSLGNGTDSFTIQGPSPTTHSRIGGRATINTGLGGVLNASGYGDEVHIFDTDFGGPITSVIGAAGSAAEILDVDGSNMGGTLSITNIYFTSLGRQSGAEPVNAGQVVVNNAQKNTDSLPPTAGQGLGAGNLFNLIGNSTVSGNLTYSGGTGIDEAGVFGFTTGLSATVGGNFTVIGGGGNNEAFLGSGNADPGVVNGSVAFIAGSGANKFFLDSGSTVGADVNVNLGDGNDTIELGQVSGGFTVGGNLSITAGNGNNVVNTPTFASSVGGNLSITFGSGTNTGDGTANGGLTPNAIVIDNNLTVGGSITYRAGSGTNTFEFDNTSYTGNLQVLLSGGNSTVNFGIPDYFGNATIDFGSGFGSKAFETDPVPTTFHGNFSLLNYP